MEIIIEIPTSTKICTNWITPKLTTQKILFYFSRWRAYSYLPNGSDMYSLNDEKLCLP